MRIVDAGAARTARRRRPSGRTWSLGNAWARVAVGHPAPAGGVGPDFVRDTAAARTPRAAAWRAANIEMLGLAAATVCILLGLWLATSGRLARLAVEDGARAAVNLRTATTAAEIAPVLTMFASEAERLAVAERLLRRAADGEPPLEHVGGVSGVTVTAADLQADGRLQQLRARAAARHVARPDLAATPLPVLTRTELTALKPHVVVRTPAVFSASLGQALLWFFGAFWVAHLVRRWRGASDDPVVLPALLLLTGIGLMCMVALRDPLRDSLIALTFVNGVVAGLVVMVVASEIDYESSWLRRAVLAPLGLALGLAALLLVFGSGPGTSGVKVNLFGVQPVEAIRLLVVFAMAAALARRLEFLRELSEAPTEARPWLGLVRLPRWRDVRPVVASMALVLAFFFLQKDLGPALVLSSVVIALYATARGRLAFVGVGFGMLAAGFVAAYLLGFPATVGQRVRIWMDPWNNGVPGGNQIAHGLWAMATGAFWGSGVGAGSPQSIPEGHTDFVLAALGEEFGFLGVAAVLALYAVIGWRALRVSLRAPGDYSALLGLGVTLALLAQAFVIASGLLGLLPLTGVVTPFLSYGRSSMLANCAAIGVMLAIARRQGPVRRHLQQPVRVLGGVLACLALLVAGRAGWVQVVRADAMATASSLSEQADGGYRFEYNPRLVAAARAIQRGSIYDRNGLVLATSRRAEIAGIDAAYRAAGVNRIGACEIDDERCYPLGGAAFSVLGDWARQTNWAARNSSFLERDRDARLKGFDDRQRVVEIVNPRTGRTERTIKRDYAALLPIVRHGADSSRVEVVRLLGQARDLQATIDARLQQRVARALRDGIERGTHVRGAAVVLDADSGEVLASVTYPWPAPLTGTAAVAPSADATGDDALLDRVRYGLYPPGSTFKLLVAAAALRSRPDVQSETFACVRLADGRVGNHVRGWSRPVRDDLKDTSPHGDVDLRHGLVVSCNAYFAQLAMRLGPGPILDASSLLQIEAARPATPESLRQSLAHAGYGQGEVLASPMEMARLVGTIANGGTVRPVQWTVEPASAAEKAAAPPRLLSEAAAAQLARYMREAVTEGTGRTLAGQPTAIAGKTGTAEVDGGRAHSWFVGFAPAGGSRRLAFAVIVENAGYGARSAAPIAGAIVEAARDLGLFDAPAGGTEIR
jgi:cell division protein FtsW (lipid II flippase)/cell division protein FtsI/penicillin-binding protein 2